MSFEDRAEAYALQNALRYGKAVAAKVVPKLLGEFPDERAHLKEHMPTIVAIVERVNSMPTEGRLPRLQALAPELLEKKEQPKRELPELTNAIQGAVVTRLPPEPSKYNHLGHALTFLINAYYAKKYDGKLVLRFEDANPEKVTQEYVDMMLADITEYLGITPDEIRYVSDDMEDLLTYTEVLIKKGGAYMCACPQEEMSKKRRAGTPCGCREKKDHIKTWKQFRNGEYDPGTFVLRFKGDMTSKNTVLRDPVLWRMVVAPHFRAGKKYPIWPLFDLYSPMEEHLCGVTHVIRSNEFDLRVALHQEIMNFLDLPVPETLHYGRFNITGATTKGREIREAIADGTYIGWDDPRLVTLAALKRRGIRRGAYETLVQQLGLSPYQVNLDFSMLAAANRDIVDPLANRYSFIDTPVKITLLGAPERSIELDLHPDKKQGGRPFTVHENFYIRKEDQHAAFRLKDCCTVKNGIFVSAEHTDKSVPVINWLPVDDTQVVRVVVVMPDATRREGLAEAHVRACNVDDVIQFERFGFCRLDEKGDVLTFWYTHD